MRWKKAMAKINKRQHAPTTTGSELVPLSQESTVNRQAGLRNRAAHRKNLQEEEKKEDVVVHSETPSPIAVPQSQVPHHPIQRSLSTSFTLNATSKVSSSSSSSSSHTKIRKIVSTRESFEIKQNALVLQQVLEFDHHNYDKEKQCFHDSHNNFWIRLAVKVSPPDTSQKELIQRSTFIIMSAMTVGAGIIWSLMYMALEEYLAALMPIIYSIVMGTVLVMCIFGGSGTRSTTAKNAAGGCYDTFATIQLVLILMLPFAVHVALGSVVKSGGVMLWSFLCPMGAAFFRSSAESFRYFGLYLGISVVLLTKIFWEVERIDHREEELDYALHAITSNHGVYSEGIAFGREPLPSPSSSFEAVQSCYFLMNILGVTCVIFAAVFLFARELEDEYEKSENVLLNILPRSIVKRIKQGELPIVDYVPDVTILFADLVGFTKASTELHPNFLIGLFLRDIFQELDELVYKHGLEKIKTIGDAYMVVGGLNHGEMLSSHSYSQSAEYQTQKPQATNIMLFAVDMFKALRDVNRKYNLSFDLRVGIHTGPVVAGVLGLKRLAYDVWGDTVNVSSDHHIVNAIFQSHPILSQLDRKQNGIEWSPRIHPSIS
jgi:adenylate cyclase